MSYMMTIDEPQEMAWFEEECQTMTPSELGALFVMFLQQRRTAKLANAECERVADRLDAFVHGLPKLEGAPYRFRRTDAYQDELA